MSDPIFLAADKSKNIFDLPGYLACGQAGENVSILDPKDLIPLPAGSDLFTLPDREPVAFDLESNTFEGQADLFPVAAFMPPGYTQLLTPAFRERKGAKLLPLFSYTPVAWYKNAFYVPAVRVDKRSNHDLLAVDRKALCCNIQAFAKTENRLINHLAGCAQVNSCPNAINFFLGRYECPLPVSPSCNARCKGCISAQPKGSCPATQPRLTFVPTPSEIAEIALRHIKDVRQPVVSFGQGCEGEPLLQAKIIKEAIQLIRQKTSRGTIHMNSNASLPSEVEALCKAGLDSIRVSLNSVRPEYYERYYSPRQYSFEDVVRSIAIVKKYGKFVALNYLVMPGFTDEEQEVKALVKFVAKTKVDMIQWRNLNYDPRRYFEVLNIPRGSRLVGVKNVIAMLRHKFPHLKHGYFNLPKELM